MTDALASVCEAARVLHAAGQDVSILNTLGWAPAVKADFFASDARELPVVAYELPDLRPVEEAIAAVRRLELPDGPAGEWIRDSAAAMETGSRMLRSVGTAEFTRHSQALFGAPRVPIEDGVTTPLKLAEEVHRVWEGLADVDLGAPPEACHLADALAEEMRRAVAIFGDDAPTVEIVSGLRANATAGATAIRIRPDACFTDMDLKQLVQHEALVHSLTAINGKNQPHLALLALGHPGTTRTQEGLAVYAEFVTGAIDPDRLRRLADRVVAIDMASEGADFLEVYGFFLEQTASPNQAFENARRVFRGGVLTGGAPFTKDGVYLDGMLRVQSFLSAVVSLNRIDLLELLFCGRLDLAHVEALAELAARGLVVSPRHLPAWVADRRFLVAHLTYSAFTQQVSLGRITDHYRAALAEAPEIDWSGMEPAGAGVKT